MSAPNLIPHIRSALASLRPAERKVADMVLSDVDFAMRASITELAQRADVSEPSVTRFCRAIGAHGLRDFKMQLAQSVAGGLPYASTAVARDDDVQTLMDKVGEAAVDGITHARGALDPAVVESAIAALSSARRVFFFGVGSGSGLVAQDAALRFLRLDIASTAYRWTFAASLRGPHGTGRCRFCDFTFGPQCRSQREHSDCQGTWRDHDCADQCRFAVGVASGYCAAAARAEPDRSEYARRVAARASVHHGRAGDRRRAQSRTEDAREDAACEGEVGVA